MRDLDAKPETFFSRTFFTYSHDNAIRAVADGLTDGAAVDSLVYDFAVERDPGLAAKVKVIRRSPAIPNAAKSVPRLDGGQALGGYGLTIVGWRR